MSGDEISERFIVGIESFLSLGSAFLSKATGSHIPPLSTPPICHLYGSDTPTTEFFLETSINEEDDVCVASDWLVLLFQFLAIHGFRSWSRWLLEPLVRKYLGQDERLKRRVETFSLVSVQLTLCVLSAWFAWRILSPQPWIWKSSEWIPQEEDLIVAPDLKFYCLFFTATLFSDLLSLKKTNKDDTWFYAVNHVVCIALVLGSAMTGYSRICCVLVVFIDWANVFRLASILCHYLSTQHDDGYQFVANRFFEVHGILFFVTRNALLSIVAWIFITKTDASVTLKAFYALFVLLQTFRMVCIVQTLLNRYLGKGTANDMFISDMEDKQGLEEHKRMVLKKRGKRKIH